MFKQSQSAAARASSHSIFESLEQRTLMAATVLVDPAVPTSPTHSYTSGTYDGKIVFQAYDKTSTNKFDYRLFATDGTLAGTRSLIDQPIEKYLRQLETWGKTAMVEFNGYRYAISTQAIPGALGREMMQVTRRSLDTGQVEQVFSREATTGTPSPSFALAHGRLYFHSRAGFYGLEQGNSTFQPFNVSFDLPDYPPMGSYIHGIYGIDGQLFARTYSYTRQDTRYREILIDSSGRPLGIDNEAVVHGKRFFVQDTGGARELRIGTTEDSVVIRPGVLPNLLAHNHFVYFITRNNDRFEVWRTNGSEGGTQRVEDYGPFGSSGFNTSYAPRLMGVVNGQLIINGANPRAIPISGVELRPDRTLMIRGTAEADQLLISRNPKSQNNVLHLVFNGEEFNFSESQIGRIRIDAGAGDDRVIIDETGGAITTPVSIVGGAGNDIIKGGSGRDTLYGGDGDDSLYGGGGNDYLWGQNGNDRLNGGGGRDILWGGSGRDTFVSSILSERRDQSLDDILY